MECPVRYSGHAQRAHLLLSGLRDIDPPYLWRSISFTVHGLQHACNPFLKILLRLRYGLSIHSGRGLGRNLTEILPNPLRCDVMSSDVNRSFGSHRALTAIRSSPVVMTGSSSLCIEVRILPLDGAHVSHEQFNFCCPLPHVAGSPDLKVLSGSLTSVRPSDLPRFFSLSDPTSQA